MKIIQMLTIAVMLLSATSCGTLIGGARYNAHVSVVDHPDASIYYLGEKKGVGSTTFLVKRHQANKLKITIREDGCPDYTHMFDSKVVRLGPVIGSASELLQIIAASSGAVIVIPLGTIIDLASGGYFKPNEMHPDITKIDYDNFQYKLDYPGCDK